MHPYINIGVKAARLIGKILVESMLHFNLDPTKRKNEFHDLTTKFELSLAKSAISIISKAYPSHNIKTQNSTHENGSEFTWLIDPLNGALNFWYGIPLFAVSIAVLNGDNIEHGVIYNPISNELFLATKGSGARLNDKRIRVSSNSKIENSLLSINSNLLINNNTEIENNLIVNRDLGSSALQLAFLAAGRLDGYCDRNLDLLKIAAGALIVKEAGGYVSDFNNKQDLLISGNILAGNPKIYNELFNLFGNLY